ncbi:uncharacterized protein LJ264_007439 [Porphyrio hochstetteri]
MAAPAAGSHVGEGARAPLRRRRRSAGGKAPPPPPPSLPPPTPRVALPHTAATPGPSERAAGRAGAVGLPSRPGGEGRAGPGRRLRPAVPSAAAEEEEERRGGVEEERKKHGAASYLRCGAASAGPGAARGRRSPAPLGSLCPPHPNNEPPRAAQGRAGPRLASPPAGDGGVCRGGSPPPLLLLVVVVAGLLLLLLAQEFLNFKEQVASICPRLCPSDTALGYRKAAGPRPAALPPPSPQRPPESIWREGEREKGRVHEDYKVTNMAPQSLLPDHCKEMKTHFKLNPSQLARSPCLPLPAQHPVQIFAN